MKVRVGPWTRHILGCLNWSWVASGATGSPISAPCAVRRERDAEPLTRNLPLLRADPKFTTGRVGYSQHRTADASTGPETLDAASAKGPP